jgi:hypothetical protein
MQFLTVPLEVVVAEMKIAFAVPPTPLVLLTNVLLNMVVFVELIDKMAPA